MSFSGAVKLDLSDFIAPSQACVVSLNGNKLEIPDDQNTQVRIQGHRPARRLVQQNSWSLNAYRRNVQDGAVRLQRVPAKTTTPQQPVSNAGFAQTREEAGLGAVKVTLQDCLACSGCVTSAETVLLEHQSVAELRTKLQVSTGSPASWQ